MPSKFWLYALLLSLFWTVNASAQDTSTAPDVVLKTRGMVCSFCVQGVEKKLLGLKSVRKVSVQLKVAAVHVWVHAGQSVSDDEFKSAIEAAGYNLTDVVRRQTPTSKINPAAPQTKSESSP